MGWMEDMLGDISDMQGEIDFGDMLGTIQDMQGEIDLDGISMQSDPWSMLGDPNSALLNPDNWGAGYRPTSDLSQTLFPDLGSDASQSDILNLFGFGGEGSASTSSSSNSGILKTVKDALSKAVGGDKNAQLLMSAIIAGIKSKQASSANNAGKNAIMATINRGDSARAGATPQGTIFGVPKVTAQQVTPATNGIYSPTNLGMSRG
jgi:hypothetical protein